MKNLLTTITLLCIIGLMGAYYNEIIQFIMKNVIYKDDILIQEANIYEKQNNWNYVQETENFSPNNKQDILNIFYTALNKGWDELTFYCPNDYEDCIDDVNNITMDTNMLSDVNNFVSTYNSYNKIYVNMNNFGRVNIEINHIYDEQSINLINKKINSIYNEIIKENMTLEEKIKTIHDYIINSTRYDEERSKQIKDGVLIDEIHPSNTAIGPLFNGKAICGGYTDAMALFLDKMGIENFKIASENHIWNVVYIDNEWKHIDLTWDDPVVNTGEDMITYNYFLITTEELKKKVDSEHNFDLSVFTEVKEN